MRRIKCKKIGKKEVRVTIPLTKASVCSELSVDEQIKYYSRLKDTCCLPEYLAEYDRAKSLFRYARVMFATITEIYWFGCDLHVVFKFSAKQRKEFIRDLELCVEGATMI